MLTHRLDARVRVACHARRRYHTPMSPPARARSAVFALTIAIAWLIVFEFAARWYWWHEHGLHPIAPDLLTAFYPELLEVGPSKSDDDRFDVLLLGGSVLSYASGAIEQRFAREFGADQVVVHNLAVSSHASRDSLFKYEWLGGRRYDLVVFYHAINEVRANNVPAELYDDRYGHYSWYGSVNALVDHRERDWLIFPFTVRNLLLLASEEAGFRTVVPQHSPRKSWRKHGGNIKTEAAFRNNLGKIIALARDRDEPFVLMSFAVFVPHDYTKRRFKHRELEYAEMETDGHPIEIWGSPENVMAGVAAHNRIIRDVAASDSRLIYADQAALIPKEGQYFGDVCHLSPSGRALFADNLVSAFRAREELLGH
jgi:hypothetical protein